MFRVRSIFLRCKVMILRAGQQSDQWPVNISSRRFCSAQAKLPRYQALATLSYSPGSGNLWKNPGLILVIKHFLFKKKMSFPLKIPDDDILGPGGYRLLPHLFFPAESPVISRYCAAIVLCCHADKKEIYGAFYSARREVQLSKVYILYHFLTWVRTDLLQNFGLDL